MVRAATLPETRMKAAAASLLVKSNLGSFLFRSSPRRSEFSCTGIGWPITSSGRGWRLARMRSGARPDNALFQGELVPGWPINRRDSRDAARIVLPGRMKSVPVFAWA